jgi:hypothetical protein
MRELLDLESWISNVILEKTSNTLGTQIKGKADRPLSRKIDILYKAEKAHPELSPEQALALYMNDQLVDNEKLDFAQNKIINQQKRDNEKLRRSLQDLSSELHDHERQAQETDREVEKLKDLSAKLKPAGEIAKVAARANADQVQSMLKDLEQVKNNPKINDQQFKEISDKVKQLQNSGSGKEVEKTQETLKVLSNAQELGKEQYDRALDALEKSYRENIAKEKRFQNSKERNLKQKGSWGIKFKDLNDKIEKIEAKANSVKDLDDFYNGVLARADDVEDKTSELENTANQLQDQVERLYKLITNVNSINPNKKLEIPQHPEVSTSPPLFDPNQADNQAANKLKVSSRDSKTNTRPPLFDPNQADNQAANKLKVSSRDSKTNTRPPLFQQSQAANDEPQKKLAESDPMITFTDEEPQGYDNMIENAINHLIPWFAHEYPEFMNKFPEEQIRKIMRRTIGAGLELYGERPTPNEIYRYLQRVAVLLNREAERVRVQVPMTDPRQQNLTFQESLLQNFSNDLDKLTKI